MPRLSGVACALSGVFSLAILLTGCGGSSSGSSGTGGSGGGGGTPQVITFTVTGPTPTAVAVKTGGGSFQSASLSAGKLTFSLPTGTTSFAVAYACPPFSPVASHQFPTTMELVIEATTADGTAFPLGCVSSWYSGATGTLTGTVDESAFPGASYIDVAALNGQEFTETEMAASGSFSFQAATGSNRVEVLAYSVNNAGLRNLVAARSMSGQQVPGALNNGSTVTLGASDATTNQSITYSNAPAGFSAPVTDIAFDLGHINQDLNGGGVQVAVQASSQYPALPAGAVQSGDFYDFSARAYNTTNNPNVSETVSVDTTTTTAGPMTFTFPVPWSYAGPTPAALPSFTVDYTGFAGKSNALEFADFGWSSVAGQNVFFDIEATPSYQNGSTTIAFPDLSGLTGFPAPPATGTSVYWGANVSQSSWSIQQARPVNSTVTSVSNVGSYTVP